MTKYLGFVTPKEYLTLKLDTIPKEYADIEIVPTVMVYMNMMRDWTAEECDNVLYIVPREKMEGSMFKKPTILEMPE